MDVLREKLITFNIKHIWCFCCPHGQKRRVMVVNRSTPKSQRRVRPTAPQGRAGRARKPDDPFSRSAPQTQTGPTLSSLDFFTAAEKSFLRGQYAYSALELPLSLPKLHWPPSSQRRWGPSRLGTYIGRALELGFSLLCLLVAQLPVRRGPKACPGYMAVL